MAEENNVKQLNELLQGKRDKLAELQQQGMDPFKIVKADVSHHSKEIKENLEGIKKWADVQSRYQMQKTGQ